MTRVLDPVIERLRADLYRMGSRSEAILEKALRAVSERNALLAIEVADDDLEIDRLDVAIDDAVLRALALQAPVASDLREIMAIKMIATDLERIGDLARNIAKSARRLGERPPFELPSELVRLARAARDMLRKSLDAFSTGDTTAAREVLDADDALDAIQDEVVLNAIHAMSEHPDTASRMVDLILVAKHLERVGDHATNIAEDVILMAEARNVKHAAKLGERPASRTESG